MKRTLVIPDLHAPFHHIDALPFLKAVKEAFKTDAAVCLGDEADGHALSYHETNPDLHSAGDELELAAAFLQELHKVFPVMRLCESNHGSLLYRRATTHGIPKGMLKSYEDIYQVKGWTWHEEVIETIKPGLQVVFRHSFGQTIHTSLPRQGGVCCVQGHYHSKANVEWLETPTLRLFGMTCGWLGDKNSLAFAYNRISQARPILACGVILDGCPHVIPMWTDARGRWTGKVSK
jgi:hypothetical protein